MPWVAQGRLNDVRSQGCPARHAQCLGLSDAGGLAACHAGDVSPLADRACADLVAFGGLSFPAAAACRVRFSTYAAADQGVAAERGDLSDLPGRLRAACAVFAGGLAGTGAGADLRVLPGGDGVDQHGAGVLRLCRSAGARTQGHGGAGVVAVHPVVAVPDGAAASGEPSGPARTGHGGRAGRVDLFAADAAGGAAVTAAEHLCLWILPAQLDRK